MSKDNSGAFGAVMVMVATLALVGMFVAFGYAIGSEDGAKWMEREAVKHGAAKYIATDVGHVEFHWNNEARETK